MKKPNLKEIERRLAYGDNFSLTDEQYKKRTGLALPKRKSYLEKDSAVAKLAKSQGYSIKVQERTIFFVKGEEK